MGKCKKNKKENGKLTPTQEKKIEKMYGQPSKTDPLGSYTGKPADVNEKPVQDVDDL